MRSIYIALPALAALLLRPGFAEEIHHHEGETTAVDRFYSTWRQPDIRDTKGDRTAGCCDRTDCYATSFRIRGGQWQALRREDKRWIPVPKNKIESNYNDSRDSPDGRGHLCAAPPGGEPEASWVYCAVLGTGT